uniref:Basonuclin zinc finger protein 1 n=1 Tax=Eptatretus burgeri TaxID=7764 RepID=A0A8C4Q6Q9_EPTBU
MSSHLIVCTLLLANLLSIVCFGDPEKWSSNRVTQVCQFGSHFVLHTLFFTVSQAIRCTLVSCSCECFQPGKIHIRTCDQCKHGWVAHALDKLSTQHLYHPTQVEIVQSNVVFDIGSLMLYGTQAVPIRLKILLDRLFSVLKQEEVLQILHGLDWTLRDYVRGYILQDVGGKVLDRWTIMSREEEIITLQQFLRFGETKSIVELMAIQEKELLTVPVPSSKADSDIRSFIESSNRTRSPGLAPAVESPGSSASSVHHFENLPSSLAFLLPFQFLNPVAAPLLGLPPNGLLLDQTPLRPTEGRLSEGDSPCDSRPSVLRGETGLIPQNSDPAPVLHSDAVSGVRPESHNTLRSEQASVLRAVEQPAGLRSDQVVALRGDATPGNTPGSRAEPPAQGRNALSSITNMDSKPETPPRLFPMHHTAMPVSTEIKTEARSSIFLSAKMRHLRKNISPSKKGRVFCNACGKTFYDKGTLKIHYNAVHLKIKHKCTIDGCNMVFSSLRSRNRHSANPNPRLHMPMLRNNRDRDLIRGTGSMASTPPMITAPKSEASFSPPTRLSLSFPNPGVDSSFHGPLVFPSIKTVQPVPPFFRSLMAPGEYGSLSYPLPTMPTMDLDFSKSFESQTDVVPKKKPRKSSMPVKIEKDALEMPEEFYLDEEDEDDDEEDKRSMGSDANGARTETNLSNEGTNFEELSETSEVSSRNAGGSTRDFYGVENGTEDGRMSKNRDEQANCTFPELCGSQSNEEEYVSQKEMLDEDSFDGSQSDEEQKSPESYEQSVVKQEVTDSNCGPYYSSYGLLNSSLLLGALQRDPSCPLYNRNLVALDYSLAERFSEDGDWLSIGGPKICTVCKKMFKNSYSVKLHYKNVHLKEMHLCSVEGCNAAFPSRRSRDRFHGGDGARSPFESRGNCAALLRRSESARIPSLEQARSAALDPSSHEKHSDHINLHRKLLTKGLDDVSMESLESPVMERYTRDAELLAKLYCGRMDASPLDNGHYRIEVPPEHNAQDLNVEAAATARQMPIQSNGCAQLSVDDGSVLDLSTNPGLRPDGSACSSDGASDEGLNLEDSDDSSEVAEVTERPRTTPVPTEPVTVNCTDHITSIPTMTLPTIAMGLVRPGILAGPISCSICNKLYSNKGTLRVHYKTVHLREMHRCKVPGCNMMFSSVRSRNRHSQNPNLHRNLPLNMTN